MILKSLFVGTALITTPLCLVSDEAVAPQDPVRTETNESPKQAQPQVLRTRESLRAADRKLQEAEAKLRDTERQLEEVLDRLDATFRGDQARNNHRNCAPSRNQSLLTHFQWLRGNQHDARADTALDLIVKQVGDNGKRINGLAWELMTQKETAGKFDEVALALSDRLQKHARGNHRYLDTIALARFLNGQFERAVATQKQALAHGGKSDDYRRRLRTYEAALVAVQNADAAQVSPGIAALSPTETTNTTTAVNDDD